MAFSSLLLVSVCALISVVILSLLVFFVVLCGRVGFDSGTMTHFIDVARLFFVNFIQFF